MSARRQPLRPDLTQLKHQAKDLLRAIRTRDPAAIEDFQRYHPTQIEPASAKLADVNSTFQTENLAMYPSASWRRAVASTALVGVISLCGRVTPVLAQTSADSASLTASLEHYARLMRRMAHDSISVLFTPTGELAAPGRPPIVGPAAIDSFLHSFSAYRVLGDSMRQVSLAMRGDTAIQSGTFWQRVQVPAGDTVEVHGEFQAEWVRDGSGSWRLRRLGTAPPKEN